MMSKKCSEEQLKRQREQTERSIERAMGRMESRIVVFIGKGGGGKTTIAVNHS